MPEYEIRELTTTEEFAAHEQLQREVWGSSSIDVPANLLAAGARHGAIILGAYSGREMVGLLYSFPAITHGVLHHHSHMLGVLPGHRRHGLGYALKIRQKELVLAQGLDHITWTVDPLEVGNNLFNFGRLGVVCRTYIVNAYGEMDDALNRGLPSDRLEVEWHLRLDSSSTSASEPIELGGVQWRDDRLPEPVRREAALGPAAAVRVPLDLRAVRSIDPALAHWWRLHLRELFTQLFSDGYLLSGCAAQDECAIYIFRKESG